MLVEDRLLSSLTILEQFTNEKQEDNKVRL